MKDVVLRNITVVTNEQDLAALRTYHYGSPDIVESPAEWFSFNPATGTITGFNWEVGRENVVIPWQIGGVQVVKLDGFLYQDGNGVVSVIAPKSLTTVNFCLMYCNALTSISLPNVTTANNSLQSCPSLTNVDLPNATTVNNSLQSCPSLTTVSLPNATTVNSSLQNCPALTSVTFSGSPPAIGQYTFVDSPNVIVYVDNPTAIGWGATFGGRPVVRLNLYADNLYQGGERAATENYVDQRIEAIPEPNLSSPHTTWTATLTPVAGVATITPADGNQPYLRSSSVTTVSVDWASYPTNGISRIALTLSGAGPYLFPTNNLAFVGEPELATNGYNRILIYRTADEPIGTAAILPGGGQ